MTRLFTRTTAILAFLASVMIMNLAQAAEPVSKSRRGVAIGGHDSVAYHSIDRDPQADAIEGSKTYVVEYKGAKWRFGSKESADLFEADPERYSPAYNGHCANALSLGKGLVRTNGETWEIFEDKLYLFYAPRGRTRWFCLLYTSPSPRDATLSRMPSSA